jgi:hypothetical protein
LPCGQTCILLYDNGPYQQKDGDANEPQLTMSAMLVMMMVMLVLMMMLMRAALVLMMLMCTTLMFMMVMMFVCHMIFYILMP